MEGFTAPTGAATKARRKTGIPAVDALTVALKEDDPSVRRGAGKALGDVQDPRTVGPLLAALKDENWESDGGQHGH